MGEDTGPVHPAVFVPVAEEGEPVGLPSEKLNPVACIDLALADCDQNMRTVREVIHDMIASNPKSKEMGKHQLEDVASQKEAEALTQLVSRRDCLRQLRACYKHNAVPAHVDFMEVFKSAMSGSPPPFALPKPEAKPAKIKPRVAAVPSQTPKHKKARK